MTVSEIVNDLLKHNMITLEAGAVLLNAELKANLFDNSQYKQNNVFQPYQWVPNGSTSNPYYVSTTTNDPITNKLINII